MSNRRLPNRPASPRGVVWLLFALALLLIAVFIFSQPGAPAPAATPTAPAGSGFQAGELNIEQSSAPGGFEAGEAPAQPASSPTAVRPTATPKDGLPTVAFADLPRQAQDTIRLIDRDGPFPYRQDGATFQNRERLLPRQPSGYYREYTVITPGESDRGARRIVAGAEGELYYTADHYASFKRVVR